MESPPPRPTPLPPASGAGAPKPSTRAPSPSACLPSSSIWRARQPVTAPTWLKRLIRILHRLAMHRRKRTAGGRWRRRGIFPRHSRAAGRRRRRRPGRSGRLAPWHYVRRSLSTWGCAATIVLDFWAGDRLCEFLFYGNASTFNRAGTAFRQVPSDKLFNPITPRSGTALGWFVLVYMHTSVYRRSRPALPLLNQVLNGGHRGHTCASAYRCELPGATT